MHKIYKEEQTEVVFLVDAANAFHSVNKKITAITLNNYLCTELLYITIPFIHHWRDRDKIFRRNNARYPVAMPVYALSAIPLMPMVLEIINTKKNSDAKMVAYADDFLCSRFNFEFKILVGYIVRITFKFDDFLSLQNHY